MIEHNKLKGKKALVTGAGRGIGRAIAKDLAAAGADLVITSRSEESLESLKKEITDFYPVDVFPFPADLTDRKTPYEIISFALGKMGGLDILVNNAGVARAKPLEDSDADDWDMHMNLNARAPFLLSKAATDPLKKSDHGTIVNIGSVVSTKGYPGQALYTASKHALMGFTKVLAQEVFEFGIRVHIICPGGVETEMVTKTRPDLDTGNLMSPEEVSDTVMFLLTHRGNGVIDEIGIRRHTKKPWQ